MKMNKYIIIKSWINARLNEGKIVQVAVTSTNACYWSYLTTSEKVCREKFGFVEDIDEEYTETLDLPHLTWSSIRRLQDVLIKMYNN